MIKKIVATSLVLAIITIGLIGCGDTRGTEEDVDIKKITGTIADLTEEAIIIDEGSEKTTVTFTADTIFQRGSAEEGEEPSVCKLEEVEVGSMVAVLAAGEEKNLTALTVCYIPADKEEK